MLTLKTATLTAALLASFGITSVAQAMIIDAFNEGTGIIAMDQPPANDGAVVVSEGNVLWTSVVGDARDLSSDMTAFSSGTNRVTTSVSGGSFRSVLTVGAQGTSKVHWDGLADGILSSSGLGGLNLLADGSTQFELVVAADNKVGSIGLTLWDDNSFSTSSIISLITATPSTYTFDFASFAGIDFTKIGAIQLSLDAIGSRTLLIDSLKTQNGNPGTPGTPSLPEPATLALLGLGLAGLGWTKRRRAI